MVGSKTGLDAHRSGFSGIFVSGKATEAEASQRFGLCRVEARGTEHVDRPRSAVQPPDRLGEGETLDPLYEVQHVAGGPAADAVEFLDVVVHREAAFGLVVEGADPLAASGRVSRIM